MPDTGLPQEDDLRRLKGLTTSEAARRLAADGPNEIAAAQSRGLMRVVWEVLREPMLLLLVAAGVVNVLVSLHDPSRIREAALLFVFVVIVIGITVFQERKTENALKALRDLSSPRALVIRDGIQQRIAGRDVVRGDLVVLAEGDRVPADAIVLDCSNLHVDESLLTGESVPVRKARLAQGDARAIGAPGGDGTPWIFSATLVVKGHGLAEAVATGRATELGRIGGSLQGVSADRTLLQRDVDRLVRGLAVLGVFMAAVVVLVYGLDRGDWLDALLAGITLAMAMLPEEFPVVLTVFLAIGAWRISKSNVLTRRMPAIEMLGAATVLCSDKTGTITRNRMTVSELRDECGSWVVDGSVPPESLHALLEFAVLASPVDPFDPMDTALRKLGDDLLSGTEHLHADWKLVKEYPLSEKMLALSHVWRSPDGDRYVIAAKGAPEAVANLCHLGQREMETTRAGVAEMADRGLRVLGVAQAAFMHSDPLPEDQHDFAFRFVGLLGLHDPIRDDVPEAIALARDAGIRVVMITGDYAGTARSIAKDAGLDAGLDVVTGPELEVMDDAGLAARVRHANVFARIVPAQKLRIVRALQAHGEVVAMTGDGVNDAPALKAADIGIAMGLRGTDVAREAAALVLTDDAFPSIIRAVRLGRRIYDNLKKAMAYILAVHVPIAGISLLPVLLPRSFGVELPLVLMPAHVAFLELIIDPACSIVFEAEAEERGIMRRAPRGVKEPLFSRRMLAMSLMQGVMVMFGVFGVYFWAAVSGEAPDIVRALTFLTLVVGNLALIFVNRSWTRTMLGGMVRENRPFWYVTIGALSAVSLLFALPWTRELFQIAVPATTDCVVAVMTGLLSVAWFEFYKLLRGGNRAAVI